MKKLKPKTIFILLLSLMTVMIFATLIHLTIAGMQFAESDFSKEVERIETLPSTPPYAPRIDCLYFTDRSCMCFELSSIIIANDTFVKVRLPMYVQPGDIMSKSKHSSLMKVVKKSIK